ncbi:MAG: BadF/BadG/BcrA/BcrD ATPase family protein [Actinomycetota bacterium]|nr:BadF/BadG/BcrA/BcrD ATPase family protein [Actinomycetota bacterium]
MEYILGVDGGAFKTLVRVADLSGKPLIETKAGSSNYKSIGSELAKDNINKAILEAIYKLNNSDVTFRSACFGMAGNNTTKDKDNFKDIIFNNEIKCYFNPSKTFIYNDTRIGLAAGSDNKNGIIIICGAGSNCFGINEQGKEAKANGWDYILSDEGSGYEIGRKALRAVMKAYDGRGDATLLTKAILNELKLKNIPEFIEWAYSKGNRKDKIASLAKVVCESAEKSDAVGIRILEEEVKEVMDSIKVVVKKLDLTDKNFDLVFVGSLFKCEKYFKNILIEKLKYNFPKINFLPLIKKPVEGAVKLALMNM